MQIPESDHPMCRTVIGAGDQRANGVEDGAMTVGIATNWEIQVDKRSH